MFSKIISFKDTALFLFLFTLFLIGNHAGSLILSGAGALGGLLGVLGHKTPPLKRWPLAIWVLLLFCLYVFASQFWSHYETEGLWTNALRFALGVPLYGLFIYAMSRHNPQQKQIWRYMLGFGIGLSALIMVIDYASGFGITRLVEKDLIIGFINKNLQHGLTVLIISMPPLLLMVMQTFGQTALGHKKWTMAYAAFVYLGILVSSMLSGNTACVIAIVAGTLFALLSSWKPRPALILAFTLPILLILFAPVISIMAENMTPETKAGLPLSWQYRVETWSYLYDKILLHPIFGNGFDVLRTYTETITLGHRDDLPIVSMHAHNIGLHLWVEVGLVGVVLAALFIAFCAHHVVNAAWLTHTRAISISATLAALTVITALSYSAWQDWWLAAIAIALSFNVLLRAPQNG